MAICKEKEYYERAFQETLQQNTEIRNEFQKFQKQLQAQLNESHISSQLQTEISSQILTIKEVSKQMVDALTFYKDLNELVAESEYENAEIFCEHLSAFMQERDAKM